jgi:PadR family transcriptional regulator, regulatory protein PadR
MHGAEPRMTGPVLKVLAELLRYPTKEVSGADVAKATNLASGTLYPILMRLESAQWVTSWWENIEPSEVKRPRRRLYRLTGGGERKARARFAEIAPAWGVPAWNS